MLSSGHPCPAIALYPHVLSASSCCGLGLCPAPPPHPVHDLTHSHTNRYHANEKCTFHCRLSSPAKPISQPPWHLFGWVSRCQIKPNIAAMDLLIFFTCPASLSLLNKLPPSGLLRPITSFSSPILHTFTFLVIPPDRPSAGVRKCNSTNSNGIIPIYKRRVSVLVLLKANIFYLTSKNLSSRLPTATLFNTRNLLKFLPGL